MILCMYVFMYVHIHTIYIEAETRDDGQSITDPPISAHKKAGK